MDEIEKAALEESVVGELLYSLLQHDNVVAVEIDSFQRWPRWITVRYVTPPSPLYEEGEGDRVVLGKRGSLAAALRKLLEQANG